MIPTHGPTVRIPDREGRINYFVLSFVAGAFVNTWTTHGIMVSDGVTPTGRARSVAVLYERGTTAVALSVQPDGPASVPELAAMLEARCLAAGIVAEHLTGEEAWPCG